MHVTVPAGRLALTSLMIVDEGELARNGVHFLRYGVNSHLDVGVGYWAEVGKPRPSVNWQAVRQSERRPAVLLGYGSEPLGEWKDDGVYVSLVKGFGRAPRRFQAFVALFHEIDGDSNHLIGGAIQSLGRRWSVYIGHYPFHSWDGSLSYRLSRETQLGLWACDFSRSTRIGLSLGTGWSLGK